MLNSNLLQFLHAWLVPRILLSMCTNRHTLDSNPILVIAPHPDDETLGCGGLIAKKRDLGAKVKILFLTDGSAGSFRRGHDQELAKRRREEAIAALHYLRVSPEDIDFFDYPDGGLAHLSSEILAKVVGRIAALMRTENICAVYAPHRCDGHPDHACAFFLTEAAARQPGLNVKVYQYAIWLWWSQPLLIRLRWRDLARRTFYPVGSALDQKRCALRAHVSQWSMFPRRFLLSFPFENELYFEVNVAREASEGPAADVKV